jgi:hypothetical protein
MPARYEAVASRQRRQLEPLWRLSQLSFVVSGYYLSYALFLTVLDWLVLSHGAAGRSVSERIFDADRFSLESVPAVGQAFATIVAGVWATCLIFYVVDRARQCLDYALSLFLIHCTLCSLSFGFPLGPLWWTWHLVESLLIAVFATLWRRRKDFASIAIISSEGSDSSQII